MSKHRSLHLSLDERQELEEMIHRGSVSARTQTRARVLLLCDSGNSSRLSHAEVSAAVMCSPGLVVDTRRRFLDDGLGRALYDQPRPGRRPKLDGAGEAQLITLACSEAPEGRSRWTLSLLADALVATGVVESYTAPAVHARLKKTRLSRG